MHLILYTRYLILDTMKKYIKYFLLLGFSGLVIWTFWFLYQKSKQVTQVFKTEKPFKTDIRRKTVASGSVMPRKEVNIKSQVSGVVDHLYVEAGQYVHKGDLIAKIRIIPRSTDINNAETNLTQAKLRMEQAQREYDRYKKLYEEKVVSEQQFNQYLFEYNQAKEQLAAAENNLEIVRKGSSARIGTSTNLVRSTVDGMILDVPVKEGGFVIESNTFNEGTTIASIADMNDMLFVGKVDESEVGMVKEGMDIVLSIAALGDKKFNAKIEFISPKGVKEDGAIKFEIKAALKLSKEDFIRSGYSANADIIFEEKKSVLAIKEALLQYGKDSVYVEIEVKPEPAQQFKKQLIKKGISDGINVEVLEGLKGEEKIKQVLLPAK